MYSLRENIFLKEWKEIFCKNRQMKKSLGQARCPTYISTTLTGGIGS